MSNVLLTPLGAIQIYIDNVPYDYDYENHRKDIRSLQEKPVAGSYRVVLHGQNWQTARCVVSLNDPEILCSGDSGERFMCSEFVKDNVILTIGAEADHPDFETRQIDCGVEYVFTAPVDKVKFGIAWATDYEGPYDIRTQLATDLF